MRATVFFSLTLLNGLQRPWLSLVHPYGQARNCWLRDSHRGKLGTPRLTKLCFSKAPPRCGAFENEDVAANARWSNEPRTRCDGPLRFAAGSRVRNFNAMMRLFEFFSFFSFYLLIACA